MNKWIVAISLLALGIVCGWLFPVEGPYDYLYDEYASRPAHHRPGLIVVPDPQQSVVIYPDFSLEDLELLEELYKKSRGIIE